MRVILGDQSVVITKLFNLVFEEADLWVRVFSGSSENSVSRCGLGKLLCLHVLFLWEQERD